MKKGFCTLIVLALFAVLPSYAQGVYFGVKGGVNNSKFGIDLEGVSSKSGYGWFVGPTLKVDILPFLGLQAAAFYDQSSSKVNDVSIKQKNVIVPIDARLNLNLAPGSGIFLSTGPQFNFNVGDKNYNILGSNSGEARDNINSTFQLKESTFCWNFGAGIMLTKNVELGYVYSIGLGKTGELEHLKKEDKPTSKSWRASLTLFF